jgi:hypothetical protein
MRTLGHPGVAIAAFGLIVLGACGGADIPTHSGYKNDKVKPWKKPKLIPFDEKGEGKADGELDYADFRRARWYAVDLPSEGELEVSLEISPVTEDEEFDLAMEVLDPNFQVITKADLDEDDAHEILKQRTLYDLTPGRYLIHLYLERRLDLADYDLKVKFLAQAKAFESDFPAQVAFTPRLPVVPLLDDTPADQIRIAKKPVIKRTGKGRKPRVDTPVETGRKVPARVINVAVSGGDALITIDRGTNQGVEDGMKGYVLNVKGGSFTVTSCTERNCKGKVTNATPDMISKSGKVIIVVSP